MEWGLRRVVKVIPLTQGYQAEVDDADYEELIKHKWYAQTVGRASGIHVYAATNIRKADSVTGVRHTIYMQKHLTGWRLVSFKDGNSLNLRRSNLVPSMSRRGPTRVLCACCEATLSAADRLCVRHQPISRIAELDKYFCDEACLTVYYVAEKEERNAPSERYTRRPRRNYGKRSSDS